MILCVRCLAITLFLVTLASCTKRETEYPTSWLRIHIMRPRTGDSGIIKLGSREEKYEVKRDGRWTRVGRGNYTAYMLLGEGGTAALINLSDGQHLIRPDAAPRLVPSSFGRPGTVTVPAAEGGLIDVFVTDSPSRAEVYRYDVDGTQRARFQFSIPETYSDCSLQTVIGYDGKLLPYVAASCKDKSTQAQCLYAGPNGFLHAVPPERDSSECAPFALPSVALFEPSAYQRFTN